MSLFLLPVALWLSLYVLSRVRSVLLVVCFFSGIVALQVVEDFGVSMEGNRLTIFVFCHVDPLSYATFSSFIHPPVDASVVPIS